MGFPHSSVGKKSACIAGDLSSITGSERCPGEGIGYSLQHSWASLVTQLVKNMPAMPETWVQSLGWEDSLEKGKATYSSILAWRIHRGRYNWMTFTSTHITYGHCPFLFFNEFYLWEWVALLILLPILERRYIFLSYSFSFIFYNYIFYLSYMGQLFSVQLGTL